jgi:thiamine biosynthesis lipoprotein
MSPLFFLLLAGLAGTTTAGPATPPSPAPSPTKPIRVSATAFHHPVEIEVRDLTAEAARPAIQAALAEIDEIERLTDPDGSPLGAGATGIAALNAAAGKGPQTMDARLIPALNRALDFCSWSEQAYGPLGRDLNRLWGLRSPVAASPAQKPELLDKAVVAASCDGLRIDAQRGLVNLAAGSAVDLWGFAEGLAVDRAVEILRRQGIRNGYVHVGGVHRGFGPGSDGHGWSVAPPLFPGTAIPLTRLFLNDKALAVVSLSDPAVKIGEESFSPWISHRTGQPVQGTVATLAFTDLALDAQGLAVTLTITGPTEGQLRLGSLSPSPAMLWLQGSGSGEPLQITYHWGDVPKR